MQNELFTECKSGFIPGDARAAQSLSITYEIYGNFNCSSAVIRGTILDILKVLDKVWHKGLVSKLKFYGTVGVLLKLLINYLEDHKQSVVLNRQASS